MDGNISYFENQWNNEIDKHNNMNQSQKEFTETVTINMDSEQSENERRIHFRNCVSGIMRFKEFPQEMTEDKIFIYLNCCYRDGYWDAIDRKHH